MYQNSKVLSKFYLSSYGPVRKPSAHITKIEPRKSNHGTRDKDDGDKQPLFVYSNISHQITAYSPTCKTLRHNMFANMHLVSCFLHFSINHLIKPTIIDLIVSWEGSWYFSCWEFPRSSWEFLKIFGVENLPPGILDQKPSHKELLLLIGLGVDDMGRITWI